MSIQAIRQYIEANFQDYYEPVSEICKNTRAATHPLNSDFHMYNFDKISSKVTNKPGFTSADALRIRRNSIELIEFKTGFTRKITKENWDPRLSTCYRDPEITCEPFKRLILKKAQLEIDDLRNSIRNKAIESYITWDKCIMTQLSVAEPITLNYVVVVDGDDTEQIEDILSDVANKKAPQTNDIAQLKQSLSIYTGRKSQDNTPYCFNSISIHTFREYQQLLSK